MLGGHLEVQPPQGIRERYPHLRRRRGDAALGAAAREGHGRRGGVAGRPAPQPSPVSALTSAVALASYPESALAAYPVSALAS